MKIGKTRKVTLLISAILVFLFFGFREEWHSLFWFGIDIGYDYQLIIKHKMRIIAAIIAVTYTIIVMVKEE